MRAAASLVFIAGPATAFAQGPAAKPRPCNGEVISAITIRTVRASELDRADRLGKVGGIASVMYRNTSWDVVRRYLFVREGQRCTDFARRESERLLRSQPFLADARIHVRPVALDTIQLDVATEDELPLTLGARLDDGRFASFSLGNSNIRGQGIAVTLLYERGFEYRDGFGVRVAHHQAFGRRWTLTGEAMRDPLGDRRQLAMRAPFYTDLRPRAWYIGATSREAYYPLQREGGPSVSVALRRTQWLAGIAWRLGRPERSLLVGPLAEGDHAVGDGAPVIVTDSGVVPFTGPDFEVRDYGFRTVRAGGLIAARRLEHVPVRGFDAIAGVQDVRTGVEAVLVAAHSLGEGRRVRDGSARERDVLIGTSVYAGVASPLSLLAVQVDVEAARAYEVGAWRGALMSGRAAWYRQHPSAQMSVVSAEFAAGWDTRVPMQVTLSDHGSGMRGFRTASIGGGARLVVRGDHRWTIPHTWSRADLALAAFVDAGRLWEGDAPFGRSTPWQASTGVSVLAATPRGSKRVWRIDLAVPLTDAGNPRRIEVRAAVGDFTRRFWREPVEMQRARGGALLPHILDPR